MNEPSATDFAPEIERIRRVADTLCTGHANLRDRYARYALLLDLSVMALATWLAALAFVQPRINARLTPPGFEPDIWGGLLAIAVLFLSIVQLRVDWKGRSDAHKRTLDVYAEVKREAGYLLASGSPLALDACRRVLARYDMASSVGVAIPEHKLKVALSKHLDTHPAASLLITRITFWLRDNFRAKDRHV